MSAALAMQEQPFEEAGGATGELAIEATGLCKRFGRRKVLRDLDLRIPAGRITGLVGPNAAGKSTLIKCLLGLVRPDEGSLAVLGQPVGAGEAYRHRVGYMSQAARFPENLTGREVVGLLSELRGAGGIRDPDLLNQYFRPGELDQPVRTLSGGTRQKLNAALAFLWQPDLLVLDEPTAGLDPLASSLFKDAMSRARSNGTTTLIASHTLSELEEVADDVVFLLEGQVRFHGTLQGLRRLTGFARLERAIAALMGASR